MPERPPLPEAGGPARGAAAFRTIGEVADDLALPAHVLRFWESKFPQLQPLKRGGGRRYYRPEDVVLLRRIRQCLYDDGYTIHGVQKLLGNAPQVAAPAPTLPGLLPLDGGGIRAAADEPTDVEKPARRPRRRPPASQPNDKADRAALEEIRRELREARALLDELLRRPGPR